MQFADATNENDDVTTQSEEPTPSARTARGSPTVPLETAAPQPTPANSATRRSNSSVFGPRASRPLRRTSSTSASSAGPTSGHARGMGAVAVSMGAGSWGAPGREPGKD